jgi:predicted RNase H-like HicB family nuclease
MKFKVVLHDAEGGFWAEVPAIPGCATQADSYPELLVNIREAIRGFISYLRLYFVQNLVG